MLGQVIGQVFRHTFGQGRYQYALAFGYTQVDFGEQIVNLGIDWAHFDKRINLLREGLDIPEVSLVAILDADKEGFLRSERSLIQTIGRAARHINGTAILYAGRITNSMQRAIGETERRRAKQTAFNLEHGITPTGVVKRIKDIIDGAYDYEEAQQLRKAAQQEAAYTHMSEKQLTREVKRLEKEMLDAAKNLEFEKAATLRDQLRILKQQLFGVAEHD